MYKKGNFMVLQRRFYVEGVFNVAHRKELKSIKKNLGTFKVEPYGYRMNLKLKRTLRQER